MSDPVLNGPDNSPRPPGLQKPGIPSRHPGCLDGIDAQKGCFGELAINFPVFYPGALDLADNTSGSRRIASRNRAVSRGERS